MGQQTTESVYAKPESICPSRVSYYASSQLTQVTTTNNKKPVFEISEKTLCYNSFLNFNRGGKGFSTNFFFRIPVKYDKWF